MSKRKKLSSEQQQVLRRKAYNLLNKKQSLLASADTKTMVNDFIEKFVLCETICKSILKEYFKAGNENPAEKDIKLDVRNIKGALNYLGYTYDDNIIKGIFGSGKTDEGNKTLKTLRNEVIHNPKQGVINEIINRNTEINNLFDSFINIIVIQVEIA